MDLLLKLLDRFKQSHSFGLVRGLAVGLNEVFEGGEFFVETGVFDWWG